MGNFGGTTSCVRRRNNYNPWQCSTPPVYEDDKQVHLQDSPCEINGWMECLRVESRVNLMIYLTTFSVSQTIKHRMLGYTVPKIPLRVRHHQIVT
jgi:hypothetical protein